ncbi:MAG: hypothetical protein ACLP9L_07720 [Thermoguttaceae bacterium]
MAKRLHGGTASHARDKLVNPKPESVQQPNWWDGYWPSGGIQSRVELGRYVSERLNELIALSRSSSASNREIGRDLGRQAVRNAHRFLARLDLPDKPRRPAPARLKYSDGIEEALETLVSYLAGEGKKPTGSRGGRTVKGTSVPKRSYTQADLDAAIRDYKAQRASTYSDLVAGVKKGLKGATRKAQEMFGRNAIAKALGVKSAAMVSKSAAWREIADELGLAGKRFRRKHGTESKRRGIQIALDARSAAKGDPVADEVDRNEAIALIKQTIKDKAVATLLINNVEEGKTSPDQVQAIIDAYVEQQEDDRSRKAHRSS